jgi:hydroxypyruvate isomerase
LNFCACIDTLFTDLTFYDRFQAAKDAGFESIEFWNRDDKDPAKVKAAAEKAGIKISGFNGDAAYSLVDPTHKEKYMEYLKGSVAFAQAIGAASVTIHSNALGDGGVVVNHYDDLSDTVKICSMYDMLLDCAKIADESGINMNLEALNITTDHVGNFLQTTRMGAEMTRLIKCDRLKLLYDVYHMQLNEGSICDNLTQYIDQIGHVHVADAPGRHEPGTGEINYKNVFACLDRLGYKHRIGFELFPESANAKAIEAIMVLKT